MTARLDDGGGSIGTSNRIPLRSFIRITVINGGTDSWNPCQIPGSRPKYIRDRHSRSSTTTGAVISTIQSTRGNSPRGRGTAKIIRRTIGSLEHSPRRPIDERRRIPWAWFANPEREGGKQRERERERTEEWNVPLEIRSGVGALQGLDPQRRRSPSGSFFFPLFHPLHSIPSSLSFLEVIDSVGIPVYGENQRRSWLFDAAYLSLKFSKVNGGNVSLD